MNETNDHLSGSDLQALKESLQREQQRLIALSGSSGQYARDAQQVGASTDEPSDYGEQGQALTAEETESALGENDLILLRQVRHALERLEAGTYGKSEVTGDPIPLERLQILPWATTNVGDEAS